MAQPHQLVRVAAEECHLGRHGLPPQQGLVGNLEQHRIALPHRLQPQTDGVADAPVRMGVAHPQEAEFTGQRLHLRILGDHRHRGELLRRHGLQGVPDQRPAVKNRRQLVLSKAPGVPRRHDHTSDSHTDCLLSGKVQKKRLWMIYSKPRKYQQQFSKQRQHMAASSLLRAASIHFLCCRYF